MRTWAWLRRHLWVWQYNVIYQEVYFVEKNHCQGIKSMAYRQTIRCWSTKCEHLFKCSSGRDRHQFRHRLLVEGAVVQTSRCWGLAPNWFGIACGRGPPYPAHGWSAAHLHSSLVAALRLCQSELASDLGKMGRWWWSKRSGRNRRRHHWGSSKQCCSSCRRRTPSRSQPASKRSRGQAWHAPFSSWLGLL